MWPSSRTVVTLHKSGFRLFRVTIALLHCQILLLLSFRAYIVKWYRFLRFKVLNATQSVFEIASTIWFERATPIIDSRALQINRLIVLCRILKHSSIPYHYFDARNGINFYIKTQINYDSWFEIAVYYLLEISLLKKFEVASYAMFSMCMWRVPYLLRLDTSAPTGVNMNY